jgi:hypothetical protein
LERALNGYGPACPERAFLHGASTSHGFRRRRRIGTSKNVMYRRRPSRVALRVAAYRQTLPAVSEGMPDTGDLRSDAPALPASTTG